MSQIARERIEILFEKASERCSEDRQDLADRYVELALRIGERAQISIPKKYRLKFCSNCNSYLCAGEARIRKKESSVNVTCPSCGEVQRHGLRG